METYVNPDGTRAQINRPYINQEETIRNVSLYDPMRPYNAGLYSCAGYNPAHPCVTDFYYHDQIAPAQPFSMHFDQYVAKF